MGIKEFLLKIGIGFRCWHCNKIKFFSFYWMFHKVCEKCQDELTEKYFIHWERGRI